MAEPGAPPAGTGAGYPSVAGTLLPLVAIPSPSGQEAAAVAWLVARMASLGFSRSFVDPAGNAVGLLGEGPRQIMLLGHIDTVPGEIPVRIEDGQLYGRGSVDAKGPLAAFVDAAAALGPQPGWQVVVIGAVDEERNSTGARYLVSHYQPEFAVIGEPSRWDRLTLGYKGSAWAELTVRQPLAHTAGSGESACERGVALWAALQGWAAAFNTGKPRAFDQLLLTLRGLSSGEDGLQEWAGLRVGARLPPDLDPQAWYARLAELAPGAEVQPSGFPLPAYLGEKNTPLVRAFLAAIRACGGQPGFVLKTGTADLNLVAPAWGCPALAYGPGDSSLDHTPNEHIDMEEYARAVQVLSAGLIALMAAAR